MPVDYNQYYPDEQPEQEEVQPEPKPPYILPSQIPLYRKEMSDTSFIELTNPKAVLDEFEKRFRGEYYDAKEQVWKQNDNFRLMNEEGIRSIMTDIEGIVNIISAVSFLDEEKIIFLVKNLGKTITMKIAVEYERFGISKTNARTIVMLAINLSFITLQRAMNAKTLTTMGTIRAEHFTAGIPQQSLSKEKLKSFIKW